MHRRFVVALSLLVSGCATSSVVVSTKVSEKGGVPEGIVYSLPRQLVKVEYTRQPIAKTEAADKLKKATEAVEEAKKAFNELEAKDRRLTELVKNIDPKQDGADKAKLELNVDLVKTKAELLYQERMLASKQADQKDAENEYLETLEYDNAFSEKLTIAPQPPGPDPSPGSTFVAHVDHRQRDSDTIEIRTKNGLLDGAVGQNEGQLDEIIVALAGGVAGLATRGGAPFHVMTIDLPPQVDAKCAKAERVVVSLTFDPLNDSELKAVNRQLSGGCIYLRRDPLKLSTPTAIGRACNDQAGSQKDCFDGLTYRQPSELTLQVTARANQALVDKHYAEPEGETVLDNVHLNLVQAGATGVVALPRAWLAKNEYDIAFSNGMLTKAKTTQPSELLAGAMMLPNMLKAIVSVPAELIKLRVDYRTSEKELAELNKAMIETQIAIDELRSGSSTEAGATP